MMGDKTGKILIRGIDSDVLKQLELMAKKTKDHLRPRRVSHYARGQDLLFPL